MRHIKAIVATIASIGAFAVLAFANVIPADKEVPKRLKTGVVSQGSISPATENWGKFLPYYEGESEHIKDILTGVAIINPGQQIHPPHKHPEEEFLMILEGNGMWAIGTKDMPANTGDIMYSNPGELHGLRNTGNVPLKFVVFKYNPKK